MWEVNNCAPGHTLTKNHSHCTQENCVTGFYDGASLDLTIRAMSTFYALTNEYDVVVLSYPCCIMLKEFVCCCVKVCMFEREKTLLSLPKKEISEQFIKRRVRISPGRFLTWWIEGVQLNSKCEGICQCSERLYEHLEGKKAKVARCFFFCSSRFPLP